MKGSDSIGNGSDLEGPGSTSAATSTEVDQVHQLSLRTLTLRTMKDRQRPVRRSPLNGSLLGVCEVSGDHAANGIYIIQVKESCINK